LPLKIKKPLDLPRPQDDRRHLSNTGIQGYLINSSFHVLCLGIDFFVNIVILIYKDNICQVLLFLLKGVMRDMVATRLDPEIKELLEKMAQEQHRPLSNLIRLIILEWLEHKGIKVPEPKKSK